MRSAISMLLAASCALLLATNVSATPAQQTAHKAAHQTGQASGARAPAAIQRVELDPISARPLKPQAAIEVAARRLTKGQTLRKRGFVRRIGMGIHRRPL